MRCFDTNHSIWLASQSPSSRCCGAEDWNGHAWFWVFIVYELPMHDFERRRGGGGDRGRAVGGPPGGGGMEAGSTVGLRSLSGGGVKTAMLSSMIPSSSSFRAANVLEYPIL